MDTIIGTVCCFSSIDFYIHFAIAFVAVVFSQLIALSSASWRLNKPPPNFVIGHFYIIR